MTNPTEDSTAQQAQRVDDVAQAAPAQPWKSHWPPQTEVKVGEKHGVAEGDMMLHDGSSGAAAKYERDPDDL